MTSSALKRRAREARRWMLDACFPLWSREGVGSHCLFREALDITHRPLDSDTVRVRVQARQTYVFCEALRLGWERERAERLVGFGVNTLQGPARRADGLCGRRLDAGGEGLTDATADLYDTAFALYALAHAARLDNPDALPAAREIVSAMEHELADSEHGGYAETLPRGDRRLQNPHMHLLEAFHALHFADPDGGYLERAGRIVTLFTEHLLDPQTKTLGEYFKPDWSAETGEAFQTVEPGHQFEWVWLLTRHAELTESDLHPAIASLYDFAVSTLDEEGRAVARVRRDGSVSDASRRTWMQTEALKAHLAMLDVTGDEVFDRRAVESFDVLMDEFLTPEGGWIDRFDGEGHVAIDEMPASTGYHVVLAFSDLIRVTGV